MIYSLIRARTALAVIGAVTILSGAVQAAGGQDWPQFRGVQRDGISAETGLADSWPASGPKELWRIPLGEGFSGISVVGDRLYTLFAATEGEAQIEVAAAFDVATGKELWRTRLGERFDNEFGDGPRATPTVNGDTVYVLGSRGDLAALSASDGKARWKTSLPELFGCEVPTFGFSTSPLADGDQLVVEAGGRDGKAYAALNIKNGKVKWTFGDGRPGYNSPLKVEMNGKTRYVYVNGQNLACIDRTGKEVWKHEWPEGETHAIPVRVAPNRLFASGAEGVGGRMFEVEESGDGGSAKEVWQTNRVRTHFNAAVLQGDHLFGFDNATLKAISVEDGSMTWGKRGLGKGSLVAADGKLYVLTDRGKLLLVEATSKGYSEKGSVQALEGKCWTAPSLSSGRLFLRNHDELVAYDIKG